MRRKQPTKRQWDFGWPSLVGTACVLGAIGYYLHDFLDIQYGLFGTLVWLGVLGAAFFFALLYFAQFILPLDGSEGWTEGLRLLSRSYFSIIPPPPAPMPPVGADSPHAPLPPSFRILKAGIVRSYYVLAVTRGQAFSRAAGPGFVMLSPAEFVTDMIDLRRQLRTQSVEANTRDGIPVETTVTVIFRVRYVPTPDDSDVLYPYDREAIFNVNYARSTNGREVYVWTEQLCPRAAAIFVDELAQYRLNDLYQDNGSVSPFDLMQQTIKRKLESYADRFGIEIIGVGIGNLQLPPEVVEQRIRTWQVDWERQIRVQRAVGGAEAERRLKNARARAQIEIIHNITQNIEAMRQAGHSNLTQIVMLRMIEALEDATADPVVQMILPHELMTQLVEEASGQMKDWLLESGEQRHAQ